MAFRILLLLVLFATVAGAWWFWSTPKRPSADAVTAAYATPLTPPDGPISVFHLGHSLVGRDMPAMLMQLADAGLGTTGHDYASQLGWGTSLMDHWEPEIPINGFETENAHDRFRPAQEAIKSGDYDAVVLTEMVELRSAIRYHDSAKYLPLWADLVRDASPDTRIYLYETWHKLDDPDGWLNRLDNDLAALWEEKILFADLARNPDNPILVIPAGQVMARLTRKMQENGGIDGLKGPEDLFSRNEDGTLDTIHLNDIGNYLVALTHYAVLYGRSPVGLPHALKKSDGAPAIAPTSDAARIMQETVWATVTAYPKTGVAR
ncbi:hypothetical protein [Primorskyibacter sp. S87]|uniref:hypothetical protein n=1 Tax=Primorskyibacter sp. S87 TaxID=3415126 RepID=UPI003C7DAFF6